MYAVRYTIPKINCWCNTCDFSDIRSIGFYILQSFLSNLMCVVGIPPPSVKGLFPFFFCWRIAAALATHIAHCVLDWTRSDVGGIVDDSSSVEVGVILQAGGSPKPNLVNSVHYLVGSFERKPLAYENLNSANQCYERKRIMDLLQSRRPLLIS